MLTPKDLVNAITSLNKEISSHNELTKESKWKRDNLLENIKKEIEEYNKTYNAELTLETPNSIVAEVNKVSQQKMEEYKTIQRALELAKSNEHSKASQLLGIQIEEDETISITDELRSVEEIEKNVEVALDAFQYQEEEVLSNDTIQEVPQEEPQVDTAPVQEEITVSEPKEEPEQPEETVEEPTGLEGLDLSALSLDTDETEEVEPEPQTEQDMGYDESEAIINGLMGSDEDESVGEDNTSTDDALSALGDLSQLSLGTEEEAQNEEGINLLNTLGGTDISLDTY